MTDPYMRAYDAVAHLTGQRDLHGQEGRAASIEEMVGALRASLDATLREGGQPDLQGFGVESMVASLCLRLHGAERLLGRAAGALEDWKAGEDWWDAERLSLLGEIQDTIGCQDTSDGAGDGTLPIFPDSFQCQQMHDIK